MQPRDKIGKSSWMIQESIKDTVNTNVMMAVKAGQIKVETAQLPTLLALLNSSIEAGFGKAFNVFMREVTQVINTDQVSLKKKK